MNGRSVKARQQDWQQQEHNVKEVERKEKWKKKVIFGTLLFNIQKEYAMHSAQTYCQPNLFRQSNCTRFVIHRMQAQSKQRINETNGCSASCEWSSDGIRQTALRDSMQTMFYHWFK